MRLSVILPKAVPSLVFAATFAAVASASFAATTDQAVLERVASGGAVQVIVELDVEVQRERGLSRAQITSQRSKLRTRRSKSGRRSRRWVHQLINRLAPPRNGVAR